MSNSASQFSPQTLKNKDKGNVSEGNRKLLTKLVLLASVVLLVGQILVARFALFGFEAELDSQLYRKADAVGLSVASQVKFAIDDLNIPVEELVGVEEFFETFLEINPDLEYMAIVTIPGEVLYGQGVGIEAITRVIAGSSGQSDNFLMEVDGYVDGAFPIGTEDDKLALHVGVSTEHVRRQFSEIIYELIVVVAISWLVAFEFIVFFVGAYFFVPVSHIETVLTAGAKGVFAKSVALTKRDEVSRVASSLNRLLLELERHYADFVFEVQELKTIQLKEAVAEKIEKVKKRIDKSYFISSQLAKFSDDARNIRVPLFLFIFSEELSRSFLPLFISRYVDYELTVTSDWLVGLPITLAMLAAMAATPIGGILTDRLDVRRVFLLGISIAIVGFLGTAFTQSYLDLVAWRMLTGVGYGLIFTASEAWVAEKAHEHYRARSASIFVGAVFVGVVCGPPIGGIFADRIGYEATFIVSAILAAISGLMVIRIFSKNDPDKESATAKRKPEGPSIKTLKVLCSDLRFLAVLVLAAVPNKMIMAGFLFYLVPLYLTDLEHTQSGIGRMLMLYGLVTLALMNIAAKISDAIQNYEKPIILGGLVSGVAFILGLFDQTIGGPSVAVGIAIAGLGFGHALAFSSQNSIVQMVAETYRTSIGKASVLSTYRLFERTGLVIGPMVVVALTNFYGYRLAAVGIGVIMLTATLLYALVTFYIARGSKMEGNMEATGEA